MTALSRLLNNRNFLGLLFMLPAGLLLLVFLTYPLGLGTWLGFTDAKIGRTGQWIGIDNFQYLIGDNVVQLALFNTLFYTAIASVIKFMLIANIVMSWLISFGIVSTSNPNVRQTIVMLDRFTNPILAPIRRIIPPFNGLDFSPIIAFLLLDYLVEPLVYQAIASLFVSA